MNDIFLDLSNSAASSFPHLTEFITIRRYTLILISLSLYIYIYVCVYIYMYICICTTIGFSTSGKEPTCQCRSRKRLGVDPWIGKIPLEEGTLVFLPGESYGQRSLAEYSS